MPSITLTLGPLSSFFLLIHVCYLTKEDLSQKWSNSNKMGLKASSLIIFDNLQAHVAHPLFIMPCPIQTVLFS